MKATEYIRQLKELWPDDSSTMRMNFALALQNEDDGDFVKAAKHLEAAIQIGH